MKKLLFLCRAPAVFATEETARQQENTAPLDALLEDKRKLGEAVFLSYTKDRLVELCGVQQRPEIHAIFLYSARLNETLIRSITHINEKTVIPPERLTELIKDLAKTQENIQNPGHSRELQRLWLEILRLDNERREGLSPPHAFKLPPPEK